MAKSGQHGGNVLEMAERHGLDPAALLDFSANINPLGMPASLKTAIVEQLDLAERYPDIDYRQLHRALSRHCGWPVTGILAGNGATELIFALVDLLRPRKALLPIPGFAEYRRALTRYGCAVIDYPLHDSDDFQPTPALLAALTPEIDCLFLCTPNNPTGQQPDSALLHDIVARCQQLDITLVVDESFLDFLPDPTGLIPLLAAHPKLFLLRSLTKFYAIPGLRLGYLLSADTATIQQLRDRREPWTINAFAALAGETVLDDTGYQCATHDWLAAEQRYLFDALRKIPALRIWRPAANYLFMRCELTDLQTRLLGHHILIRHCANYPGLDARYYRVAIRDHAANQRLVAALQQELPHG